MRHTEGAKKQQKTPPKSNSNPSGLGFRSMRKMGLEYLLYLHEYHKLKANVGINIPVPWSIWDEGESERPTGQFIPKARWCPVPNSVGRTPKLQKNRRNVLRSSRKFINPIVVWLFASLNTFPFKICVCFFWAGYQKKQFDMVYP